MSFQAQINELNQSLEQISAGIIKLMVDIVDGVAIHEIIIKVENGKEYIVCHDKIKAIEMHEDGEYSEKILDSENVETQAAIDALKLSIQAKLESGIQYCCSNIKSVAKRPSAIANLISIKEPATVEDCYEFTLTAEEHKYVMIDDECPYLLERVVLQNGQEDTIVLSSTELTEAVERISALLIPIIAPKSFEETEIVELTKDAELRQAIIDDLRQKIQALPACVIEDEDDELIIRAEHHIYSVFADQLIRRDGDFDAIISSKECRLMLQDAHAEILEACDIIAAQGDALKACYEKVAELAKSEDCPEFIFAPDPEDDEKPYYSLNLKNIFYTMYLDQQNRVVILHQIEEGEGDDLTLIAAEEIEGFVLAVANDVQKS